MIQSKNEPKRSCYEAAPTRYPTHEAAKLSKKQSQRDEAASIVSKLSSNRSDSSLQRIQDIKQKSFKEVSAIRDIIDNVRLELAEAEANDTSAPQIQVIRTKLQIFEEKATRLEDYYEGMVELELGKQGSMADDESIDCCDTKINQWIGKSHQDNLKVTDSEKPYDDDVRDQVLCHTLKPLKNNQIRDLPTFDGDNPMEFFIFREDFDRSTRELDISDSENLIRLNKALKGKARETVLPLLTSPQNVKQIMRLLHLNFARKEWVMTYIVTKIRNLQNVIEGNLESFTTYYNTIIAVKQLAIQADGYVFLIIQKCCTDLPKNSHH